MSDSPFRIKNDSGWKYMIFRCGFSLQSDEQIYSRVIEDYFENLTYFKIGKLLYLPHCEKLTYHFKWRVIWNKVNSPLHEFEFKNWNVKVIFGSTVGGLHQRGGWVCLWIRLLVKKLYKHGKRGKKGGKNVSPFLFCFTKILSNWGLCAKDFWIFDEKWMNESRKSENINIVGKYDKIYNL